MPPLLGPRVAEAAWRRGIARAPRTSLMSQRTGFAGCQSRLTTTAALSLVPLRYRDTGGDRHLDPGERSHVSHGCTRRTGTIDHTAQECRAHLNAPGRCLALVSYVIFYDTFMIPIVLITVKRIAELCIITIIYKEIVLRDIYMHHDMEVEPHKIDSVVRSTRLPLNRSSESSQTTQISTMTTPTRDCGLD